jgi:hypothetical protein
MHLQSSTTMQMTGSKLHFFKSAFKCHPGASHHSPCPLTQHQHLLLLPAWQMGFTAAGTTGHQLRLRFLLCWGLVLSRKSLKQPLTPQPIGLLQSCMAAFMCQPCFD